jgi:hypothetical protein
MNNLSRPSKNWRLLLPFLLLALALTLGLAACGEASTPGATATTAPPNQTADQANGGDSPSATAQPQRSAQSKSENGGTATEPMMAAPDPNATYQWIGEIMAGDDRGVELRSSTCGGEVWALTFADPELEKKAVNSDGQKVIIWGKVSTKEDVSLQPLDPDAGAVVSARPAIAVEALYLSDEPMPEIYVQEYPCMDDDMIDQMYAWIGAIVVSDVEGRHLEIDRGCDSWVLIAGSDEVARRLEANIDQKVIIWGQVSRDPSIYMRQAIKVSSVHLPGDPIPAIYVPEYPCGGAPDPIDPGPIYPNPDPYTGIDLELGEIAAAGLIVRDGDAIYLDTPAGKILLKGEALQPWVNGGVSIGTLPCCSCPPPDASKVEVVVAGKWELNDDSLTIHVRYITPRAYDTPCPRPEDPPQPVPPPADDTGVLYGQVHIGPLCPVEPCSADVPNPYESRALHLQPATGEKILISVPLTPDGWFKWQLAPGAYIVNLSDCDFMGCSSALPVTVDIKPGEVTELQIRIDTGIR